MMGQSPSSAARRRDSGRMARGESLVPPDEQIEREYPPVEEVETLDARRSEAAWTAQLIYFVFGVVEILIALRVLLKLIAANTGSGFTRFIYGVTGPFVAPFKNIVDSPTARNGAVFEVSSILAIVIYLLINWLIVRLLLILIERPGGWARLARARSWIVSRPAAARRGPARGRVPSGRPPRSPRG
jgi:YggT family protein